MNNLKIKKCANKFYYKINKLLTNAINGKRTNASLKFCYVNDLADLIKYCNLILSGNYRKAQILQLNFDTMIYELIPNQLWKAIEYGYF